MEITTRDQVKKGTVLYCVRVSAARDTRIEAITVTSDPYKREYGDGEFFMWAIDAGGNDQMSIADMGIDQIPQYNRHRTFTSLSEAEGYEGNVRIDYASLDEKNIEFGGEIYNINDNDIDPNELIPFNFDDCVLALNEMNLDWVADLSDASEENHQDAEIYNRIEAETETAYDRAMKGI